MLGKTFPSVTTPGQHLKIDVIPQMGRDIVAHALKYAKRYAAPNSRIKLLECEASVRDRFDFENLMDGCL
jgi:hypothetical protein